MEISPIVLSSATHNIANAHGITMGCRRVGTTNLLWLFSDEDAQNGVTFVVEPGRLRPLFVGHPYHSNRSLSRLHARRRPGGKPYLPIRSQRVSGRRHRVVFLLLRRIANDGVGEEVWLSDIDHRDSTHRSVREASNSLHVRRSRAETTTCFDSHTVSAWGSLR